MEEAFTDAKENFEDEEVLQLSLDKDIGVAEDNYLLFSASKLKIVIERVMQNRPLTSAIKQQRTSQRCLQDSDLENQCDGEHRIPKYMSLVSLHENLVQHCYDLVEIRASDSINIFYRAASATSVNFPVTLRPSKLEILFDRLKPHRRRTRSTSDLGIIFTDYTLVATPENIIFSPVGQWFFYDRKNKVSNLMQSPLIRHLGSVDGSVILGREKSCVKDSKSSEFISSPLVQSISSPQKQVRGIIPLRKQRYGSEITDKTLVSSSSTSTSSSYQSTTSPCGTAHTGLLHCIWKNGLPYFMFSVDVRGDVYVANPCKVESLDDKALDYIYLFHSRMADKKESCADNMSDLVGKMKVSSSLMLNLDNEKLLEKEFILFGASEDCFVEMQSSAYAFRRNKGLPKKVVDMFKTTHSSKHKSFSKFGNPSSLSGDFSHGPCLDMLGELNEFDKVNLIENHLPPNLELAAIIVKDYLCDEAQEEAVGGWGLKFLKKVKMEEGDTHLHSSSGSCQDVFLRNKSRPIKSLNVLVPAGLHGGPKIGNGGPSHLTERWRSGGHCDCGGWDTGCPLTVLNSRSGNTEGSLKTDAQEDCSSFDLFIEGAKEGEPTLKMVNVHEGLYFIHFQSTLSALQSFSIGVAIIHSRNPSLCLKLYKN